ncbi:MAG: COG4315 family predicted lipoprotein [Gaiellaceae bacterium]
MRTLALLFAVALLAGGAPAGATTSAKTLKLAYSKELKAKILVDGKGLTLYMFGADPKNVATCTKSLDPQCPKSWPPLRGPVTAGAGVSARLIATATRSDGIAQVSYNGHALYYFGGDGSTTPPDRKPGQINGQNFLSLWWVLDARGRPIKHG